MGRRDGHRAAAHDGLEKRPAERGSFRTLLYPAFSVAVPHPVILKIPLAYPVSVTLTLFWVFLVTKTVDAIDGLDGLAAGVCAISAATLALMAGASHQPEGYLESYQKAFSDLGVGEVVELYVDDAELYSLILAKPLARAPDDAPRTAT